METQSSQPNQLSPSPIDNLKLSPERKRRVNKKLIAIIIAVVIIIVAAGAAAYCYFNQPKQVACTMEAKLCPDGSSVGRTGPNCEFAKCPNAQNETADWKIYQNEEYGLEVKYPQNWYVYSSSSPMIRFSFLNISNDKLNEIINEKNLDFADEIYGMTITVVEKDIQSWLAENQRYMDILKAEYSAEKIKIGSNDGYKLTGKTSTGEVYISKLIYNSKRVFLIDVVYPKKCQSEECAIFNQILSTFKFIDSTANWKTYYNDTYGFEFKYPNKWVLEKNLLSPQKIEYYEIGSDNAPILFGVYSSGKNVFLNSNDIFDFTNLNYQITNSKRRNADSKLVIDEKEFKIYDLEDYGRYEGTSAGNVVIAVSPLININGKDLYIAFEWQEFPGAKKLTTNNKNDFFQILSTFKFTK